MKSIPESLYYYMADVLNSLCRVCQGVKVNNASGICRGCRKAKCQVCGTEFAFKGSAVSAATKLCERHRASRRKKSARHSD